MKIVVGCIGVGGVFYHGISRMATFCNKRGSDTRVVLVDHDKVEPKNAVRQWGVEIGREKVNVAYDALMHMTGVGILPMVGKLDNGEHKLETFLGNTLEGAEGVLVISAPDNHMTRWFLHRQCKELAATKGIPVMEITGGNSEGDGYAYGCKHLKTRTMGAWIKRHQDIVEEAYKEIDQLAHPMPCGNLAVPVIEQTMEGNCYTAGCIWDLAEYMVETGGWGEKIWSKTENPTGVRVRNVFFRGNGKRI